MEGTIEVEHAYTRFAGHGHQHVHVTLNYRGERAVFNSVTSNMPGFDETQALEGQEKYEALYRLVESALSFEVELWCESIDEQHHPLY